MDAGSVEDDDESWEDISDEEELEEDESKCISHSQRPQVDSRDFHLSDHSLDSTCIDVPVVAEELHQAQNNLDDSGIIIESSYNQSQLDNSTLLLDETYCNDSLLEGGNSTVEAQEEAVATSSDLVADIVHGSANSKCLSMGSPLVSAINEATNFSTDMHNGDVHVIEGKIKDPGTMNSPVSHNVHDVELIYDDLSVAKVQKLDKPQPDTSEIASDECHVTEMVQDDLSLDKAQVPDSEQTRHIETISADCHDAELVQDSSSLANVQQPLQRQTEPSGTASSDSQGIVPHQENEVLKMSNIPLDGKECVSAQSLDASKALRTIDEDSESEELADAKAGLPNRKMFENRSQLAGMKIPEIVFSMVENQPELDDD